MLLAKSVNKLFKVKGGGKLPLPLIIKIIRRNFYGY